jgi:uncharacterized protein YecE (DUF72 family)
MILIGTSGYSFQDWRGTFYPEDIEDGRMLDYYKKFFNAVEINSTYYRIPSATVFYHLDKKTPPDFHFIVKVHKQTTHEREGNREAMESLLKSTEPLIRSGKLKGFLAQFPYSFKDTPENREYILETKKFAGEIPLIVEFRHISWVKNSVYEFLRQNDIPYVCVDEPRLKGLIPPQSIATSEKIGYIRFHGRNEKNWWEGGVGERYDYFYTESELREWIPRIKDLNKKVETLYIFFNNCHRGSAPKNAQMLQKILEEEGIK